MKSGVIFVPGLGGGAKQFALVKWWWKKRYGCGVEIFEVDWYGEEKLEDKLIRLLDLAREMKKKHGRVTVIGTSAGGSLAFNALAHSPTLIYKAINVGGRLRRGYLTGYAGFERRTAKSLAFRQSVIDLEDKGAKKLRGLTHRLMTVRAKFGDQLVPGDTAVWLGAKNITIPWGEHVTSNALGVTVFVSRLVKFLNQ